jgi:hypothetical protein
LTGLLGYVAVVVYKGEWSPGKYPTRAIGLFSLTLGIFYVVATYVQPMPNPLYNIVVLILSIILLAIGVFYIRRSYALRPYINIFPLLKEE